MVVSETTSLIKNLAGGFYNGIPTLEETRNVIYALPDILPILPSKIHDVTKKLPSALSGLYYLYKTGDKDWAMSMGLMLENNAEHYPNNAAIKFEDRSITYYELNCIVNQYADYLLSKGIKKGDHVAILLENRPEYIMMVLSLNKIGAIGALINNKQQGKALIHSFNVSEPCAYIIGEELMDCFLSIKNELQFETPNQYYFLQDKGSLSLPNGFIDISEVSKYHESSNPHTTIEQLLMDSCFLVFTSGTTGLPKASIMTNQRYVKACYGFGKIAMGLTSNDIIYVTLPLYHNNALTLGWGSAISQGACIALRRKFSASNFWNDCRHYNATSFIYIGELCRYLLNQPKKDSDIDNSVQKIIGNGLRPEIWNEFKQRFGIHSVYELYAASEANIGFVNILNIDGVVGCCPYPFAIVQYDLDTASPIRDENGHFIRVKRGETGLLLGKITKHAPYSGYTSKTASNAKILTNCFEEDDQWFNTGDLMKNIGFWHAQFVDRLGDTFRWKGENVSTTEVEMVVNQIPEIQDSTCYGVSIKGTDGCCGMITIVLRPDMSLNIEEIFNFFKEHLPIYAIPVFIRIAKKMEITGTFKNRKVELRKEQYNPLTIEDPLYVLLPKTTMYQPLTKELYQQIIQHEFKF